MVSVELLMLQIKTNYFGITNFYSNNHSNLRLERDFKIKTVPLNEKTGNAN